jgi:two-component system, chemotaxis family, protein-glutamate methylesterase/glutaminase
VVLHIPRDAPSALPAILDRAGLLPARHAVDGESLAYGRVYIARSDHHLLLTDGRVRLTHGPSENGHRPAIDPLFRSAAQTFGPRVVAVVLSGSRDDGAAGAAAVAARGGVVVVQDPAEALHTSMPTAVLRQTQVDHVLPAAEIGRLIAELSRAPSGSPQFGQNGLLDAEVRMAGLTTATTDQFGVPPSEFACPSCGGVLFEIEKAPIPRFRCRVGHAWSAESLLDEQHDAMEGALWVALRALEEKSALADRLARSRDGRGERMAARRYRARAQEADLAGTLIRELINRIGGGGEAAGPGLE